MKVTIEPSAPNNGYLTVSISGPSDDIDCEDALEMVLNALVAWGYNYDSVFEEREVIKGLEEQIKELQGELDNELNRPSGNRTKTKGT